VVVTEEDAAMVTANADARHAQVRRSERAPTRSSSGGWQPPADLLLAAVHVLPDGLAVIEDGSGPARFTWTNPAFEALLGYEPGGLAGRELRVLDARPISTGDSPTDDADVLDVLLDPDGGSVDSNVRRSDGSALLVHLRSARVIAAGRRFVLVSAKEISTHLRTTEQLRAVEERFRALTTQAPIGVFFSEVGLRLGYVNERLLQLWDRPLDELLGTAWLDGVHDDDRAKVIDAISGVLGGVEMDLAVRIVRPSGDVRWVRMRATQAARPDQGAGFVGSVEDITAVREQEEALEYQATHDPLTGLPNRSLLWGTLNEILSGAGQRDPAVCLLFFDLDNFKLVNDSLGHSAGDELLIQVAERLGAGLRPGDMVSRFGGDEFVVLCRAVRSEDEALKVAERLLGCLSRPFPIGGGEIHVSASVGVAVSTSSDLVASALVRDADVAMYQAKGAGKARVSLFDMRVRSQIQDRLALTNDLRRAIDTGGLDVAFQPIVDVESGRITKVEALVRWTHPTLGPIAATDLVHLAEESSLIGDVGDWVLDHACIHLAEWRARLGSLAPGSVAVNLSGHQLSDPKIVERVASALARSGLDGASLCLELTESILMRDVEETSRTLNALRALGVGLAVDDFGTGYSSLAYLRRFPVDTLKIDRTFVASLTEDEGSHVIVGAVMAMAAALDLAVIAEGIETEGQRMALRGFGCLFGQGYLFGRPMAADDIVKQITSGHEAPNS
jgi:diguanylate cyclase (GGDEF)-like protein/PAS domain S-box-containing protein